MVSVLPWTARASVWPPGPGASVAVPGGSAGTARQVVDLADPATASFVIPGGSSGDPASPHLDDQLAACARHERIAMFPCPD
jgi:acyl-homoserine lactone acylase PvdQ